MRTDAVKLEESRLGHLEGLEDYDCLHERHRAFPEVFESRAHKRILDLSAGAGAAAVRILERYRGNGHKTKLVCNDLSPSSLRILRQLGLPTVTFDIDNEKPFPFLDGSFDAIISLATIEHLINIDYFLSEIARVLEDNGYLYLSAPNYSGILYLIPFLLTGKTFHDPLKEASRYEFYGHVRYFTYRTLRDFVTSFGFSLDSVYLPLPQESSRYKELYAKSRIKALTFRTTMNLLYRFGSPRWASEPVLCFCKSPGVGHRKPRKVVL
jgi:SAM-dependent methyltransferase